VLNQKRRFGASFDLSAIE